MNNNKKKLIIFDFDGVIVDSWTHGYERSLKDWPEMTPEQHRALFNGSILVELEKLPKPAQSVDEREEFLRTHHFPTKIKLPLFEGIREIIEIISKNAILVINSGAERQSTENYLKENRLDTFFQSVYGKETSIDKVENFHLISKKFNTPLEEALFITDTVGDVKVANSLKIPTILVSYGYQGREYFGPVKNSVLKIVDTPEELLNAVLNN